MQVAAFLATCAECLAANASFSLANELAPYKLQYCHQRDEQSMRLLELLGAVEFQAAHVRGLHSSSLS